MSPTSLSPQRPLQNLKSPLNLIPQKFFTQIQLPIQNFQVMFKCNRNYRDISTFTFQMVNLNGIRNSLAPDLSFKYSEALKLSLKVSQSLFDSRRFGLGSLLFFLFCFSVLVFGSDRKRKKVCDKTNAPWDTEWDLRSSHWPKHLLKTPFLPFYRFISSVYRFSSFIPKNRFDLLVLAKLILAHGP